MIRLSYGKIAWWVGRRKGYIGGFTLIEVLVAMAVMGITLAGLSQISGVSAKASRSLAHNLAASWQGEQAALYYVSQLKSGNNNAPLPENIGATLVPSSVVTGDERERLVASGWQLVEVTVYSHISQKVLWQGNLLLRVGPVGQG